MRKSAIRCCGRLNEKSCSNILAYISSDGKLTTARHGRTIEILTKENSGSVVITCERCGHKNKIEAETIWKVRQNN